MLLDGFFKPTSHRNLLNGPQDAQPGKFRFAYAESPAKQRRYRDVRGIAHNAQPERARAHLKFTCGVVSPCARHWPAPLWFSSVLDGVRATSTPWAGLCSIRHIRNPKQRHTKATDHSILKCTQHPPPYARGSGASAPTAGQGLKVFVFSGAFQGTAWAGFCLIHHYHQHSEVNSQQRSTNNNGNSKPQTTRSLMIARRAATSVHPSRFISLLARPEA